MSMLVMSMGNVGVMEFTIIILLSGLSILYLRTLDFILALYLP
jgi:hypothetical protein